MTNLMTILERKAFISSNPRIVLSSCPPPCGHFSIQESATGGLSYKVKRGAWISNSIRLSIFQCETCLQQLLQSHTYSPISITYSFHNKIYTLIHFHMGTSRFEIFSFLQIYFYLYYLLVLL